MMDNDSQPAIPPKPTLNSTARKSPLNIASIIIFLAALTIGLISGILLQQGQLTTAQDDLDKAQKQLRETKSQLDKAQSFGKEKIDPNKVQAVFLANNQVYFGKISEVGQHNITLIDIYYLKTEGSSQSLVKLGCELHRPKDEMIINRSQLTFWENLKDDSEVSTAIRTFKKQNPDGQKCAD